MFVRTQFAADLGGYFPEIKAHPEKYILKRRPEFRQWLQSLRDNGKYLYVITGQSFFDKHKEVTSNRIVSAYNVGRRDRSEQNFTFAQNHLNDIFDHS